MCERLTNFNSSLKLLLTYLQACLQLVLAWRFSFELLWATLSYGYLASKALYWGSLFMTILHSTVRLLEGFFVDSSTEINWQFWLQLCRSNEVVLSVIDEPRKSFAQESHHPVAFDHFLLVVRTVLRCNANRAFALVSHFMSFNLTGVCSIAIWLSVSYLQPKQILT